MSAFRAQPWRTHSCVLRSHSCERASGLTRLVFSALLGPSTAVFRIEADAGVFGCMGNLLLSHNPAVFPVAVRQGYNLMLSGHTHGGQINVEIYDRFITPARFFTPCLYGLYRDRSAAAYVTRGIGTIGIPARIGAPPEVSMIRLRKA